MNLSHENRLKKDWNYKVIIKAARFKVDFSISLADSIALGLGKELSAKVVTADHNEFDKIEEIESADFYWIR
jgi:predicted nucleic acid-binding protein